MRLFERILITLRLCHGYMIRTAVGRRFPLQFKRISASKRRRMLVGVHGMGRSNCTCVLKINFAMLPPAQKEMSAFSRCVACAISAEASAWLYLLIVMSVMSLGTLIQVKWKEPLKRRSEPAMISLSSTVIMRQAGIALL